MNFLLLKAPEFLSNVLYIGVAILVLLFMITVHEFGHYVSGKLLGFKINEFAIGFGPKLFKKRMKGGELFSLRCIPLGGFCAFEGEDEEITSEDSFDSKAPWKRLIVLFSGAFMNFLTTVLIIICAFVFSGQYVLSVAKVLPNSEDETVAVEYMLQEGDILLSANGKNIYLSTDLSSVLAKEREDDGKLFVEVLRGGERKTVEVHLRKYVVTGEENGVPVTSVSYGMGILQTSVSHRFSFFESIGRAFVYCMKMAGSVLGAIGQILTGAIGLDSLGGPITTITMTAELAQYGFRQLLEVVALIGANLAVFNLLPIPALDGSRMLFTTIEWIRKKPINKSVESAIHFGGLIFLFLFAILVDLIKIW